jgi:HPt (histidine-containing phosphotransfer) domain-containing protein
MKTLQQLCDELESRPKAEWEPEIERWIDEHKATLSPEEFNYFKSQVRTEVLAGKILADLATSRGAEPHQKMEDVITPEDVRAAIETAKVAMLQPESDTKH